MLDKNTGKNNSLIAKLTTKKIVLAYTILSILWFCVLDKIIFSLSVNNTALVLLQSAKNFLFILFLAATLHYLLTIYTKRFLDTSQELEQRVIFLTAQNEQLELAAQSAKEHFSVLQDQYQQHIDKLKHISIHDKLTGLTNRTYFELQLERLQDERYFPIGIMVCNVDCLKLTNNTFGYASGDKILLTAANLLKNSLPSSIISRIGSDEFVVVFKNTSAPQMQTAYDTLRQNEKSYNTANPAFPISLSIGWINSEKNYNMNELFSKADQAMYHNKIDHNKEVCDLFVQGILTALQERHVTTHSHFEHMQQLIGKFARSCNLSSQTIRDLQLLAKFHDIGNIGISPNILNKQGRLTPDECNEARKHSDIGYQIARAIPSLMPIADLISKHHEWWNGQGYPFGLKEEQIPLECRILAIADAFDAMISDRPYRTAMPLNSALQEISKCSGSQFDPELAEKFLALMQKEVPGN